MRVFFQIFLSLIFFFSITQADAKEFRAGIDSRPEVMAPNHISDSFSVELMPQLTNVDGGVLKTDRVRVSIHKNSLEKEFLLQPSFIPQTEVPMFEGGKSRIVAFKQKGKKLYLLEATQGHEITPDFSPTIVLTDFSILEEDENWLTFDFNEGMSRILVAADWYGHDFTGKGYQPDFRAVKIRTSYLEDAALQESNRLVIRQIVMADPDDFFGLPYEVRYYLSPYQPDSEFVPTKSKGFDRMGFFEVAPQYDVNGAPVIYAAKFHSKKPILFAISANTPREYRDAIRDGILYWNKALGEEQLQVVDAPATALAPDPDYNIVQWIKWDWAGFAYADAQMDPRTGEALHAQVFLTSVFAVGGKRAARRLLRMLESGHGEKVMKRIPLFSLAGFEQPRMCDLHIDKYFKETLANLLESNADDAAVLKFSQDLVREVTAHEIGHTLGLRHNFAGSLAANYPLSNRGEIVKKYLDSGRTPEGVVTSSSVMEYQLIEEGAISGSQMAERDSKALSYDEKAIRALYKGESFRKGELPLFCTDSHVLKYLDCIRFDIGKSPIEFALWATKESFRILPNALIESYIAAKAPPTGFDPNPLEDVSFSPRAIALNLLVNRVFAILSFMREAKLLQIHRQFPNVDSLNQSEVKQLELQYLKNEFERLGGLESILFLPSSGYSKEAFDRFVSLVESDQYVSGIGGNGERYEFTLTDLAIMKNKIKKLFASLPDALAKADVENLSDGFFSEALFTEKGRLLVNDELTRQFASLLEKRVNYYLQTTVPGEDIIGEIEYKKDENSDPERASVSLPLFAYSLDARIAASKLLQGSKAESLVWGLRERDRTAGGFKGFLKEHLGGIDYEKIDQKKLDPRIAEWLLENLKVVEGLGS